MLPDGLRSLPYLVHTNRELGLMLKGLKPLSYFVYIDGTEPDCIVRYFRMFDRHVALGRFIKEVHRKPVPRLPSQFLDRTFYALPGEQWRISAMTDLIDSPGSWNHDRERRFGSLLGTKIGRTTFG